MGEGPLSVAVPPLARGGCPFGVRAVPEKDAALGFTQFRAALANARKRGIRVRLDIDVLPAFILLSALQLAFKSRESAALLDAGVRDIAWKIRDQIAPEGSDLERFVLAIWEGDGRF